MEYDLICTELDEKQVLKGQLAVSCSVSYFQMEEWKKKNIKTGWVQYVWEEIEHFEFWLCLLPFNMEI